MKYCTMCGKPYEEGLEICPYCGAPLPVTSENKKKNNSRPYGKQENYAYNEVNDKKTDDGYHEGSGTAYNNGNYNDGYYNAYNGQNNNGQNNNGPYNNNSYDNGQYGGSNSYDNGHYYNNNYNNNYNPNGNPGEYDSGNICWGVLGCCIPLVGLILFLVWKDTKPRTAKAAGIGALISVIAIVGFYILVFILGILGSVMY